MEWESDSAMIKSLDYNETNLFMEDYLKSQFYEKYHASYYSDSILKVVFAQPLRKHSLRNITAMSYKEIYENNVHVMKDFLDLFWNGTSIEDDMQGFQMIKSFYIDPDFAAIKKAGDITCTADALISLKRLYAHEGVNDELVQGYERYRRTPIFFFPKERNGINVTRATLFGDKIDFTLFDIKRYLGAKTDQERQSCRLINAYKQPITKRWLNEMSNFETIVDWLGIRGIFTNEKYEVYDIEKGNAAIIDDYLDTFPWMWSVGYYNSIKLKIEEYMNIRGI